MFLLLALCAQIVSGSLYTRKHVIGGPDIIIPASDPSIYTVGRFLSNPDGSKSFDWENTVISLNVKDASYVKILLNTSGGMVGRFLGAVDGWEVANFYVGGSAVVNPVNDYLVAFDLYDTRHVSVTSTLEPAFGGSSPSSFFTFLGFATDGTPQPPTPRTRKIELVGDSISAGYGSRGYANTPFGCPVDDNTSGNRWTYNWMLAENFTAQLVPIAWSGKGMYENCCDNGITMPSLYLQTLAGRAYSTDWDFASWVPDTILINLGTNDFSHDKSPSWEAAFTQTYVSFVLNATARYNAPKLPVFVAQGPMNNGANLYNALQSAISKINAAGGNAIYLDMRGPPNDGCGGHPGVEGHKQSS